MSNPESSGKPTGAAPAASQAPAPAAPAAGAPAEGAPPKTAKELEKERKKAEKLAKFNAKKAAQADKAKTEQPKKPKKEKKVAEPVPEFIDETKPGEKKVLVSLEDPAFKAYNPKNVESSWYAWWESQGFFKPELTKDGKVKPEGVFSIPAPPPNVTGALHIGHALTIAIQDALIRYNRMKGKTTLFLPGFDHAGIATQSVVEKQVWAQEKKTRHDYGREKFIEKVWEWKEEYHNRIKGQVKKLGASYDWSREAFTLSDEYNPAVIENFVKLHEDGTIYRASRLVNWSVKLNTAISNLEVDNKNISGRTLLDVPNYDKKVEFGVLTSFSYPVEGSDEKLTVATTRPETIFGDTGVAVHPDDARYKHLHGKYVLHPFLDRKLPIVTDAEAVDMEFGTGAVKITPGHDQNDHATGKRNNLEVINIYTDDGYLNETCGPEWAGMKRFDARVKVIEQLKEKGLFVDQKDNEMAIPVCSRSGDIIEPLLKPQWWVKQSDMAKEAIEVVKRGDIKIIPKTSESEYFHWLENIQDWCISRQLWWGHRCPVYFVKLDGVEEHDKLDNDYWVAGRNLEEAQAKADKKFPNAKFTLEQDEDVLDTWFSSALWPIATLGWPNKNAKDLELFGPFSLLETGWDILFFWVTRMILLGVKHTGQVPFKEVFCHSLVRDAQGRKMSKSLGNVVDPLDVIAGIPLQGLHDKLKVGNLDPRELTKAVEGQKASYPNGIPECGSDALRFALCAYSTGGRDINLDIMRVEGYRKFCNKIYQATKFVLGRLGEDYKPPQTSARTGKESLVEKWILHKLTHAAKNAADTLDSREFGESTNHIYNFWYELCDVYIENSKSLIQDGTPEQQQSAKDTLYTCIDSALRMIHPYMPFVTEEMWQRLPRREGETTPSIVVAKYPEYSADFDDVKAHDAYELVLEITKGARSLLAQYNIIKNGQVYVESANDDMFAIASAQQDSIVSLIKGVEKITVVKDAKDVPSGCALQAIGADCTVHVLVKGQIDLDAEIAKVQKKLGAAREFADKTNEGISKFTDKTKESAKESAYKRLEKFTAEIEGYEQTIAILEKLKL
ncbi:valyl-tRNA synthetase [Suhomyces tanzawaensis NRRL Y-17324]|uniref:Valine--tRNA ligase, mitochondrial n=1 Tax=Suhomyces tanzawaensis NRRL Y-17324 TaxID=984487 RepID=A0A1E4SR53_9ASCO|nr:valyl-tRNA synthetase [Suhomyces tanzawaensis NRRL Y-17324]ODV81984.1 valyl-tRNA synthetase [Suhomyces tanzawaensis NRRL Y-17324]